MPDMIDLMTQGIAAGKEKLKSLLQGFSGDLSFMTQANVVQPETVSKVGGGNDSKSVSITQNVNIDNQFNGDRAGRRRARRPWTRPPTTPPVRWLGPCNSQGGDRVWEELCSP